MVFFDGAAQGSPYLGGAGSILLINDQIRYHLSVVLGRATNNHVELQALGMILQVALSKAISKLHIFCDPANY